MLKCAEKAFGVGRIPYPLLMIDTGHNFHEVTDFRDLRAKELGAELIVRSVEDSMARGTCAWPTPAKAATCTSRSRCSRQLKNSAFDALIGGARRDEEKARAKERIFSHRDELRTMATQGPAPRVVDTVQHPAAGPANTSACSRSPTGPNWTSGNTLTAKKSRCRRSTTRTKRAVVERKGLLVPVTELTPAKAGETVELRDVRFAPSATSPALAQWKALPPPLPTSCWKRCPLKSANAAPPGWTTRPRKLPWRSAKRTDISDDC